MIKDQVLSGSAQEVESVHEIKVFKVHGERKVGRQQPQIPSRFGPATYLSRRSRDRSAQDLIQDLTDDFPHTIAEICVGGRRFDPVQEGNKNTEALHYLRSWELRCEVFGAFRLLQ